MIRIAIVGVGNCASSLVQGLAYYQNKERAASSSGLMHFDLGGYIPQDIQVVAAFDVDCRKVGKPLNEALFAKPNCTKVFQAELPSNNVIVQMGTVLDGISPHMAEYPDSRAFRIADSEPCDIRKALNESKAEMLLNYLPVGSEKAAGFYAEACLDCGVSLVNCMPVMIASEADWEQRFAQAGIPIIGDDVKAQLGATIVHRVLTKLFMDRGVAIDHTYQLNVGGNTDFLNMLNRERLKSKKLSKTEAVQSQMKEPLAAENIHVGPSDYIAWQNDNKVCFLRIEGRGFGDVPLNLELRLSVEDSPNSAGVVIDAIRCCRLARDRKLSGAILPACAYLMKRPPQQMSDSEARQKLEEFIAGSTHDVHSER